MEPILQAVLAMRPMRDHELLTMQARSLEALASFIAARPASAPAVLQKARFLLSGNACNGRLAKKIQFGPSLAGSLTCLQQAIQRM